MRVRRGSAGGVPMEEKEEEEEVRLKELPTLSAAAAPGDLLPGTQLPLLAQDTLHI